MYVSFLDFAYSFKGINFVTPYLCHFFFGMGLIMSFFLPSTQVPVVSWFDDFSDMELLELIPLLEKLNEVDDVCAFLRNDNVNTLKTRCHPFDTS